MAEPAAIFLHTGWRTCGTWIWSRFRVNPSVCAFYEPLHEDLDRISRNDIRLLQPTSWKSGHSITAAYFAEYEKLLTRSARGVDLYRREFAFDNFFMDEQAINAPLEAYICRLVETAQAEGRLPVLKFTRSLGRMAWLQSRFPKAVHLTVLRDPGAQWESARRQFEVNANRYFLLAPFVILSRNAHHPLVADALARLDVPMPPRLGDNLRLTMDVCWRHVTRLEWNDRYRGFLAFWSASAVAALQANATIIDSSRLTADAAYRRQIADMIAARSGLPITLEHEAGEAPLWATAQQLAGATADMAVANHEAAKYVAAHRDTLSAGHADFLVRKLAEAPGVDALVDLPDLEHRPAQRRIARLPIRTLDAALYVFLLRATLPLRRLHGNLDRLWEQRRAARRAAHRANQPAIH
jgi:hypothetical protein